MAIGERIEPRARLRPATAPSVSPIWRAVPAPLAPTPKSAPRAMANANGSRAKDHVADDLDIAQRGQACSYLAARAQAAIAKEYRDS